MNTRAVSIALLFCTGHISVHAQPMELAAFWPFDEGDGIVAGDLSLNGNDGSLLGGVGWTTGRFGSAVSLSGNNQSIYVSDDDSLDFGSGEFTILFWGKSSFSGIASFVSKGAGFDSFHNPGWGITYANTPESLYLLVGNGDTHIEHDTGLRDITDWTQIGLLRDADDKIFYIENGAVTDTGFVLGGNVSNSVALTVGTNDIYGGFLNGQIDDLSIWNTALSQDDISFLFENGTQAFIPEPTAIATCLVGLLMLHHHRRRR